jgi:hypothetical protein
MKPERGFRKVHVTLRSAWFLLAGLVITLATAGYFKMDTEICIQGYLIFTAGVTGVSGFFSWSNRAEHAQPKPEGKPLL